MAYKKPQMVAKSPAKKSYVAGCPNQVWYGGCDIRHKQCELPSQA